MSLAATFRTLQTDLSRHYAPGDSLAKNVVRMVGTQSVWATTVFRLGQWVYEQPRRRLRWVPGRLAYWLASKGVEATTGISLPASVRVGPGLYIGHFSGIFIHSRVVLGRGCSVGQGVTIGTRGHGDQGVPVLGDGVYVGAGAKVLGGIRLGDGAAVGANAVVLRDVPPGHVAVGVPAHVQPRRRRQG